MKRTVSQIDGKTKKSQQSIQYNILEEEEKKKTYKSKSSKQSKDASTSRYGIAY